MYSRNMESFRQKLLEIKGYKPPISFRRPKGQQGGGVAIFVKIGIDFEEIKKKAFKQERRNMYGKNLR